VSLTSSSITAQRTGSPSCHGLRWVREGKLTMRLRKPLEKLGATPLQVALAWLLKRAGVILPIPEHLRLRILKKMSQRLGWSYHGGVRRSFRSKSPAGDLRG